MRGCRAAAVTRSAFLVRNNRSVLGVTDPYFTSDTDYGNETHYWQGVDVTLNARTNKGLMFQGGTSTGRGVNDTCAVLTGRFGRPMTPSTTTTGAVAVIDGQPACSATRALADVVARARVVHDSEDRRPGERDSPLAVERAAGRLMSPRTARRARRTS